LVSQPNFPVPLGRPAPERFDERLAEAFFTTAFLGMVLIIVIGGTDKRTTIKKPFPISTSKEFLESFACDIILYKNKIINQGGFVKK
jgi:hypothetical protein